MKEPNKKNNLDSYARFSSIVLEMLIIIGGGTWLGHKIDENSTREFPLFTVILSMVSVAIALYVVIYQVNRINNDKK